MTGRILPDLTTPLAKLEEATKELIPGSLPFTYVSEKGNYVVNIHCLTIAGTIVHGHTLLTPEDMNRPTDDVKKLMITRIQMMRQRTAEELRKHGDNIKTVMHIDHDKYRRMVDARERSTPRGKAT